MNITFSPVSEAEQIALTRKQMKTILKLTKGEGFEYELVGHNPSATVELYATPTEGAGTAYRHHISDDGTYDSEQCEVPQDDGDWDWGPVPTPDWVVRATRFTQTEPAYPGYLDHVSAPAKVKKPKKRYLSEKFTIRRNPNGLMLDDQWEHEDVKDLPVNQVWTVVEGDNGKLYACPGFHLVNKLHYVVTEEPWTEEDENIDYKW